jgi:hypothetical protein
MSKVVSPLDIYTFLNTVPDGHYRIELWIEPLHPGEDARLLLRDLQNFISNPTPRMYINQDLEFEIARVSEFGQLRISTYDVFERPVSIASADLILLSIGGNDLNPPGDLSEKIVINEPTANTLIQGGSVIVSGQVRPASDGYLLIELIAPDGAIVGYRQVAVIQPEDGGHVPFAIDVPYSVSDPTWVRLVVKESAGRIPGVTHLSSVEVLLSP